MDTEQDGMIRISELAQGFKNVGIEISNDETRKVFECLDIDHNGKIKYSEFLIAALDQKHFTDKESLIAAFNYFDFDGSGYIDKDDLDKALLSTGHELIHKDDLNTIIIEATHNEKSISLLEFLQLFGY